MKGGSRLLDRLICFISLPLLLSVRTTALAFLWVCSLFVAFVHLFMCFVLFFCLFVHVGVRELTLLFSHLQRQRNTKKVLHNSYHTLLSGLRPYSSPYLSGDRYATASQYIPAGGQKSTFSPTAVGDRTQNNTLKRCTQAKDLLLPELSAWMRFV